MTDAAGLARLADIELPAAPADSALPVVIAVLLVIVAIVGAGWLWHRARQRAATAPSPPEQALARLGDLRRDWEHGDIEDREAAYRLGTLLRRGLELRQLDDAPPPPVDRAAWQGLLRQLEASRYRRPAPPLSRALFDAAGDCLARRTATETTDA